MQLSLFTLRFYAHIFIPSHAFIHTFIRRHSPRFLFISSSLFSGQLSWKNLPGVPSQESNLGPAIDSKPIHYQLSYTAPYWATPHPAELRHTLLSYAAPCWAMSYPDCTELLVLISIFHLRLHFQPYTIIYFSYVGRRSLKYLFRTFILIYAY